MPARPDSARVQSVFHAAAEIGDPAERAAYIATACASDVLLRRRVEALLKASDGVDSVLDGPLVLAPVAADVTVTHDASDTRTFDPAESGFGFDLGDELGRGGVGVVYRAVQRGLNRTVAVKMPLGGTRADPKRLIRFLAEAETVAAVRHANVVEVFEYGNRDGVPYLVMEHCPEGDLAGRLKAGRPAPRAAAELVGRIAAGVAAAHERGIVHRDLKPSNVLFAGGEPKVSDFGLAKRGGGADLTLTQAVMGTPAYMSPEQARGDAKFVGPPADVWALGVILYECLTGARPFDADSTAGTLTRIQAAEPVSPRAVVPAVPRDLERICLHCLAKPPHERYPTAKELATDLGRFLAGQPISVRPVGSLERGFKWVKRNKVVAGAVAAVGLALAVGAGVSLGFGLEAREQARQADIRKREAEGATGREANARAFAEDRATEAAKQAQRAEQATAEAVKSRDEAQAALARYLLAPLRADRRAGLNAYEADALRQLARYRGSAVSSAFLDEATRTPAAGKQLEARAEYALHAAVGLDSAARDRAARLLLARLDDPAAAPAHRLSVALAVARGEPSAATADRAADLLISAARAPFAPGASAVQRRAEATNRRELVRAWAALVGRTEPARGAESLAAEIARMTAHPAKASPAELSRPHTPPIVLRPAADGLAAAAGRLPPADASRICAAAAERLLADLARSVVFRLSDSLSGNVGDWAELAEGVAALASRVEPDKAAALCDRAAALLADGRAKLPRDAGPPWPVALGLTALAARMEPGKAAAAREQAAALLLDSIHFTAANGQAPTEVGGHLAAVLVRIEPGRAAKILTDALTPKPHPYAQQTIGACLVLVADTMPPEAAGQLLTDALAKPADGPFQMILWDGLAAVAARMEPEPAARLLGTAFGTVKEPFVMRAAARHLADTAHRLEPDRAAAFLSAAFARTNSNTTGDARQILWDAQEGVKMRQTDPAAGAKQLARIFEGKSPSGRLAPIVAHRLSALAPRLDPETAADLLLAALGRFSPVNDRYVVGKLAHDLATVAARMPSARGAEMCDRAAALLCEAAVKTPPELRTELAVALAALAGGMSRPEAARATDLAAALVLETLDGAEGASGRAASVDHLLLVASHLAPERGARLLLDARAKGRLAEPAVQTRLARALTAITLGRKPEAGLRERLSGTFPPAVLDAFERLRPTSTTAPARPLPAQVLVDLLKHPFCVGDARRAVLDALAVTYARPFTDVWEFVAFARASKLPLDLLAPPTP